MRIKFPENKKFAFSIFDDTDGATIENVGPVYELLTELKIYTTKSVWVLPTDYSEETINLSPSLSNPKYLSFILELKNKGFEIGFHGARGISSKREDVIFAIEHFKKLIGYYPKVYANHLGNRESLYWGENRLNSPLLKSIYKIVTSRRKQLFIGHLPSSEHFWGDIAKKYLKYVRNFTFFPEINTLKINPSMPYCDPKRPYVNYWFSSSDGHDVTTFNKLLSKKNIDKLEQEGGVCIVYTHFANNFVTEEKINPLAKDLLFYLSKKNGLFLPVSALLDYLLSQRKTKECPPSESRKMEYRWFLSKIIYGTS